MLRAIEHIAILARDTAALSRWYCETLGFEVAVAIENQGQHFLRLPGGDFCIELLRAGTDEVEPQPGNAPGMRHLALVVDDYDAAAAELESRGVEFSRPHPEATGGARLNTFPDPEGNVLQLVWRPHPLGEG